MAWRVVVAAIFLVCAGCSSAPTRVVLDDDGVAETGASQLQHVNIEDGSTIHMDARTRLKVDLKPDERIIHLFTGQAVFDVISDHQRPFTVRTELVNVTAVGARFAVQADGETGVTTIVETGVVEVAARDRADGEQQPVRVYPNEQLHVPRPPR